MSPIFGVKEQKCLVLGYSNANEALAPQFPKLLTLSESVDTLSRNRDPNVTQNEYVYAIFCPPEVAGDVISSVIVKTIESYVVLNFETASISSLRKKFKSAICVTRRRP